MDAVADVRPIAPDDRAWVRAFLRERWGSECMVAHGVLYYPAELPGFLAIRDGQPTGFVVYEIEGQECEIVLIDSGRQFAGIGTALVEAVRDMATQHRCRRLWLVTTNDNLAALRFYQRRGFALVALQPNAVEEARRLKPEIPLIGDFGIPLRDEIELEMNLPSETETPAGAP